MVRTETFFQRVVWFGPHWGSHVNQEGKEVATPSNSVHRCHRCLSPFEAGDQGIGIPIGTDERPVFVYYHRHHMLDWVG